MKVVLHICCGVCSAGVVERLTAEGHEVRGFFYNPNIHPKEEYERRLKTARRVARELSFPLEAGLYTPEEWLKETNELKDEPESGARCEVCFRLRLKQTYDYLMNCGWDAFTTTLTVTPRKSAVVVNQVGREIGCDRFLARDFKKQDGFKRSIELAKQWALYRQNYCGCLYSMRKDPVIPQDGGFHR
ncbi:MAG: epoxyqueuosine reductase QueH [Chloroflexi bacterium]|nr:epoxyqueuosine reductase QueH [Chloroflexota bacterium]